MTKKPRIARLVRAQKNEVMCGVKRTAASCTMMLETVECQAQHRGLPTSPRPPRVLRAHLDVLVETMSSRPLLTRRRRPGRCLHGGRDVEPERQQVDHARVPRMVRTGTVKVRSGSLFDKLHQHAQVGSAMVCDAACSGMPSSPPGGCDGASAVGRAPAPTGSQRVEIAVAHGL
ncbi:MAG: hypothetical protein U0168_16525 [Nannocystaceae bacterium]